MTVTYHAGRRIQGLDSDRTATQLPSGSVGGWVELGRTTAGGGGSDVVVSSLSDKRYYMVLSSWTMSTSAQSRWRFNNDTGTNYAGRVSSNGGGDSTITSQVAIPYNNPGFDLTPHWNVGYIANRSANEKLWINHQMNQNTAGATYVPGRQEQACKWSNTSNAINEIRLNSGGGTYNSGSEVVVLGWDPADSHTNNFWQELASVELGGTADQISSGTITAKKYLWIQAFVKASSGVDCNFTFNNDTSTNYSRRLSDNGGADTPTTSASNIPAGWGNNNERLFINIFIINNASTEKLVIQNTTATAASGAGSANNRREGVSKWSNTSAQITKIDIDNASGGDYQAGSILKVWGAD